MSNLRVAYGGVVAVTDASFEVRGGEILGLVGPNGAGKTSLLDGICGFTASSGEVTLDGIRIDALPPHRRQRAGIGRTWQDGGLFDELTVLDNLAVAAEPARPGDIARDLVGPTGLDRDHLMGVLRSWGLAHLAERRPDVVVGRPTQAGRRRPCRGGEPVGPARRRARGRARRPGDARRWPTTSAPSPTRAEPSCSSSTT